MSNLSRSQKNQALYDSIKSDSEATISQDELLALKDRVKGKLKSEETTEKVYAKRQETYLDDITDLDSTLSSDALIKSFISEVKKYNIKSGLRTVEDTNLNILSELEEDIPLSLDIKSLPEKNEVEIEDDLELTKQNISEEIRRFLEEEKTYEAMADEAQIDEITQAIDTTLEDTLKEAEIKDDLVNVVLKDVSSDKEKLEETIKDIISDVLKVDDEIHTTSVEKELEDSIQEVVDDIFDTDLSKVKELETDKTQQVKIIDDTLLNQKELDKALNKDRMTSFFAFLGTLFFMVLVTVFAYWFLTKGVN